MIIPRPLYEFKNFLASLPTRWQEFFFDSAPVLPLVLFRIFFGILLLFYCVELFLDVDLWFGPSRFCELSTSMLIQNTPRIDLLLFLPDSEIAIRVFIGLLVLASIGFTLGKYYRTSAAFLFFGIVSLHHHVPYYCNASDSYIRIVCFFMMLAPANDCYAGDSWVPLRNAPPIHAICTVQRILQIQLCAIYFQCFFAKCQSTQWFDGSAIYYVAHLEQLRKLSIVALAQSDLACVLLGWSVLAIEFSLAFLVWVPKMRYFVLLLGLLMHIGIELTMNLPLFEYLFVATYILFIDPVDLRKFVVRPIENLFPSSEQEQGSLSPAGSFNTEAN